MKNIYLIFLTLSIIVSCTAKHKGPPPTPLKSLESLVRCDRGETYNKIVKKIKNEDGFVKSVQDFYKPVQTISAFGFIVSSVGLVGVDMIPGPNITVKGKYKDVEKKIKRIHEGIFQCGPGGCDSQIDEYLHLMVCPHPDDEKLTIIQCGYFGP
jgi:hypothetical protein